MLKVLLVNPPMAEVMFSKSYDELGYQEEMLIGPPHSLCALAGNIPEFEVEIVDFKAEYKLGVAKDPEKLIEHKLGDFKPSVVGITVMTSEFNNSMRILKRVKEIDPQILTVAGGIHPTLCPEDLNNPWVDICVIGHGKKIFRDILFSYYRNEGFLHIPNIAFKKDGKYCFTQKKNLFADPGDLGCDKYANRELIRKYLKTYMQGGGDDIVGYIETSTGCPFKCNFCSVWPASNGKYYCRESKNILAELKCMEDTTFIRFVDANTTGNINHIGHVFDDIIRSGIRKDFMIDIRTDTIVEHEDLIKKAVEAGVVIALIGIESINEADLKFYNKRNSVQNNIRAIEILKKYDIIVRSLFMIRPEYEEKDFKALKDFVKKYALKYADFPITTPIPGTSLYKQYQDKITEKNLDYYNFANLVLPSKLPAEVFYGYIQDLHD